MRRRIPTLVILCLLAALSIAANQAVAQSRATQAPTPYSQLLLQTPVQSPSILWLPQNQAQYPNLNQLSIVSPQQRVFVADAALQPLQTWLRGHQEQLTKASLVWSGLPGQYDAGKKPQIRNLLYTQEDAARVKLFHPLLTPDTTFKYIPVR